MPLSFTASTQTCALIGAPNFMIYPLAFAIYPTCTLLVGHGLILEFMFNGRVTLSFNSIGLRTLFSNFTVFNILLVFRIGKRR